jgi:hypothetical protein
MPDAIWSLQALSLSRRCFKARAMYFSTMLVDTPS